MNFKTVGISSIIVVILLAGSFGYCMSEDTNADVSVNDWAPYIDKVSIHYVQSTGTVNTETAVHISDLNTMIPIDDSKTWSYVKGFNFTSDSGEYRLSNAVNLSSGDTFSKLESSFAGSILKNYVLLCAKEGSNLYTLLVCYEPVYKYDVNGTLTAGTSDVSISATAKMAAEATAKLDTPMFYVIAHYNDGKFISTYISATAADDGALTLANMGVSKTGLVDVMVGVVGGVPSDDTTVYYGEKVLTLAVA